jgi:hypothetical protein
LILPKLILFCNFVEDILFKTGFFIVQTSKSSMGSIFLIR